MLGSGMVPIFSARHRNFFIMVQFTSVHIFHIDAKLSCISHSVLVLYLSILETILSIGTLQKSKTYIEGVLHHLASLYKITQSMYLVFHLLSPYFSSSQHSLPSAHVYASECIL